ncbi:GNAT family N-acetyltransferase [Archaeoglobales archaeon]|nr:MAG: GNAT family N-acetyltransferase [Archaeoglobales archaeon]
MIAIRVYDSGKDREDLVRMYKAFSPAERTLGLPPESEEEIERWIDFLSSNGLSIVAEMDGRIVGHLAIVPEGEAAHLTIFVHKDFQNRGIGQKMVSAVVEMCRDAGYERIIVTTDRNNMRAIHVFEKTGFFVKSVGFEYEMHLPLLF